MIYLKSVVAGMIAVFAGIVALIVAVFLTLFAATLYMSNKYPTANETQIGWDPVSLVKQAPWVGVLLGLVPLGIFLAGFFWEFRRASR
ncbi:MAG: hypothetical protein WB952_07600 [Terriglobales bacterium]